MVEKTRWTIELSPKTQRILKNRRSRGSAKLNSALFDGFCNVRKHLFRSVEINTNKPAPSEPHTSWARRSGRANKGLTFAVNSGVAYFGNRVSYVKYLEKGTRKMEPRPAMKIALKENNCNIIECLENAINKVYGAKKKKR